MGKHAFDKKIEALDALRAGPPSPSTIDQVRKALRDRNNYLVSKAAALTASLQATDLIPDLIAAFDRFLLEPLKSDPQCWAKNAVAKALKDLGHRDAQIYLRGLVHVQLEPVFGGRADSAGTLRGACALALVDCQLDDFQILTYISDGLADPEMSVRIDTALAISQLGRPEGALLLRLKALIGDSEPEVLGQCFASLLSLNPRDSITFITRFLKSEDDNIRAEAAAALALAREPEAIEVLKTFWNGQLSFELRVTLIACLGASPLLEAAEFLLSILATESGDLASAARKALAASRFREQLTRSHT